jgi:hypothetical protein
VRVVRLLPVMALLATGASPPSGFITGTPMPDFRQPRRAAPPAPTPQGYTSAPTPDQDSFAPQTKASEDASVGPGLFTRRDQYRGEGLSASSSAQIEQDRRAKPGAGIKLSMPLQ